MKAQGQKGYDEMMKNVNNKEKRSETFLVFIEIFKYFQ